MLNIEAVDYGRGVAKAYSVCDGDKADILFMAANGLPVASYTFFLQRLATNYNINAIDNRGSWPDQPAPVNRHAWSQHAADLLGFVKAKNIQQVHGVGHSLGATVSVLAALQQPELYKSLILIEPASLETYKAETMLKLLPESLKTHHALIKSTAARQSIWPDRETFIRWLKTKKAYKEFCQQALDHYASHGLQTDEDGELHLVYNPAWEAHNFSNIVCLWRLLPRLTIPTLVIRAQHTYIMSEEIYYKQQRHQQLNHSQVEFMQLDGLGHMAVQQAPDQVADVVQNWLARHS